MHPSWSHCLHLHCTHWLSLSVSSFHFILQIGHSSRSFSLMTISFLTFGFTPMVLLSVFLYVSSLSAFCFSKCNCFRFFWSLSCTSRMASSLVRTLAPINLIFFRFSLRTGADWCKYSDIYSISPVGPNFGPMMAFSLFIHCTIYCLVT